MNLVYIAPFLRLPSDSGGAIRAFNLIRCLARHHSVSVITYESDEANEFPQWSRTHLSHLTLLQTKPWSMSSQGHTATLRRLGSFPPESFQHYPPAPLIYAIDREFEQRHKPDLLIFDTLMTGRALSKKRWPAPAVLSLYDIASDYQWRIFTSLSVRPYKIVYGIEWLKTLYYETRIVRSFRLIVTVSPKDTTVIRRMHSAARVIYMPNGVDTRALSPIENRLGNAILFVGNWAYAPNADGLWHFYEDIWPRIRSQLNVQFLVVGRHPPARFIEVIQQDPSVRLVADVPDVRPYYAQARVSVVPLLSGGGTRLKILEAFALGVPVVSTTKGCEGLDVKDGETLIVADDPVAFADAVVSLFRDKNQSNALARNARALVESRYDWENIARDFQAELEQLAS